MWAVGASRNQLDQINGFNGGGAFFLLLLIGCFWFIYSEKLFYATQIKQQSKKSLELARLELITLHYSRVMFDSYI